jgi:hypothetical protein
MAAVNRPPADCGRERSGGSDDSFDLLNWPAGGCEGRETPEQKVLRDQKAMSLI